MAAFFVALAIAGFFAVLLFMTAVSSMAWLLKPEGIRPPWWDWGMDKLAEKAEKPEIEVKVEIPPELPEAKVETVEPSPAKLETKKPHPKW